MKRSPVRFLLYGAFVVLLLLHNDLWLWENGRLVLGLPIGLLYHIGYAVAAPTLGAEASEALRALGYLDR